VGYEDYKHNSQGEQADISNVSKGQCMTGSSTDNVSWYPLRSTGDQQNESIQQGYNQFRNTENVQMVGSIADQNQGNNYGHYNENNNNTQNNNNNEQNEPTQDNLENPNNNPDSVFFD